MSSPIQQKNPDCQGFCWNRASAGSGVNLLLSIQNIDRVSLLERVLVSLSLKFKGDRMAS